MITIYKLKKMKKLNKLTLGKISVDQSDILKKREMKNITGGRYDIYCCAFACGNGNEYCGPCGYSDIIACTKGMAHWFDGCDGIGCYYV